MRLLLVADTFPPATISGALQMRDLAAALVQAGHRPLVLVPDSSLRRSWVREEMAGIEVCRVRAPRTKDVSYLRRVAAEIVLPWVLRRGFRAASLDQESWDGIAWYSPTIFLGPLVAWFKRKHRCRSYLILRDLFPDWAVDAGVLRRGGPAHRLFKAVERLQYRQADVIGVQTPANVPIVAADAPAGASLEVLHNWLAAPPAVPGGGRHPVLDGFERHKVFVYAGNMGVAQDLDAFLDLASRLRDRPDIAFLLIGRGSEQARLGKEVVTRELGNLRIADQVSQRELSTLLAHCYAGIIALHPAHGTHNIPGKLLTYLQAGLPVLARVNPGNDLHQMVMDEGLGASVMGGSSDALLEATLSLADRPEACAAMGERGKIVAARLFSPAAAAEQVVKGLSPR
ncbi:glycosyltransferase family 4 protein [Arenimonas sp.]|uniref:glycosyltransferase family 4 protein n=1 Tax=Arenimonas sp. TaxID=1872635 RepID=UPI002E3060E4|nr:glycosyltransferase family 4 protein [Arenimonas sp.]HEX4854380.1 glycosyltransferase family 4 protein [Arenimonas sp.]